MSAPQIGNNNDNILIFFKLWILFLYLCKRNYEKNNDNGKYK